MDKDMLGLFEDALQRFNRERHSPARLPEHACHGSRREHWREMAELGWLELAVGSDAPDGTLPEIVPLLSIYRAAGDGLWFEAIDGVFGAVALIAHRAQDAALRSELCEGLANGSAPLAYADRERGDGWGASAIATRAQRLDDGFTLSGHKVAVVEDASCAGYLVTARDVETGRAGCYLVMRDAHGLGIARHRSVEGRALADLHLEQAPAQLVCEGDALSLAAHWAALLAAAESVGIMRGALQDTVSYLQQRRQFGRPLIDFQALQHRLADMLMLARETEALLQEIAEDLDAGQPPADRLMLVLRVQVSRALRQVTREAVQMHGGMGVTQECRVSHYYRRALTLDSLFGSDSWALERLSSL